MEVAPVNRASAMPEINTITTADLFECLGKGWQDYKRAPLLGLFFSIFYVVGGYIVFSVLIFSGEVWWVMPFTAGFPLIAPFAAVGLYETSHMLERGEKPTWGHVIGATFAERKRQIPWVGAIIVMWFLIYMLIAHAIFAITLGLTALTNITTSWDLFFTFEGAIMLIAEFGVGGAFGFALFAITLVSLPLLLDKELDFVTAIILSIQSVFHNIGVLIIWALLIGLLMAIAMLPAFLGLFIVLPVLGHATWHLYRKLLSHP